MFSSHRRDLKEAHAKHVEALEKLAIVLSDQVDWLRWQLSQKAHVSPPLFPKEEEEQTHAKEQAARKWLSEEEEDILALRMNDYLTDADLQELEADLGIPLKVVPVHDLEPDE
jgi:type I site-specific restriction endonuclease